MLVRAGMGRRRGSRGAVGREVEAGVVEAAVGGQGVAGVEAV